MGIPVASEQILEGLRFLGKAMPLFMLFPSCVMPFLQLAYLPLLPFEDSSQASPWMKTSLIPHRFS